MTYTKEEIEAVLKLAGLRLKTKTRSATAVQYGLHPWVGLIYVDPGKDNGRAITSGGGETEEEAVQKMFANWLREKQI